MRTSERGLIIFAAVGAALRLAVRPSTWNRAVREELARQVINAGLFAVPAAALAGIGVGVFIVVQAQQWLDRLGHVSLLGPLLVVGVVREIAPLVTNLLVIGRSGSSMTTEVANMKMLGDVDLLEAQGIDPFVYLVVPRILGMGIAVLCLNLIVLLVSLISGRLLVLIVSSDPTPMVAFADNVLRSLEVIDVFNLLAKTVLTGMLTGAICCVTGLQAAPHPLAVAAASRASFMRCMAALLTVSGFVSLSMYLDLV
ncbi:putative phospholipid ABC transporter permease protein MlaE [Mucisphaera calidilacus]|uniref:Putative phospholipid ABC transporter permease protein MlaE n=2 Tax=Mucisphaera calidilacus TaxID=2527982 RepID=A0A518BTP6_9BACT|nr:putative phospholipid ABC transporter permease protein MlaE [Mucisphaera calidilacus]